MRLGASRQLPDRGAGAARSRTATVLHIVAIVSGILGFMLMYALPKSLYAPSARNLVVASNIYANMYCRLLRLGGGSREDGAMGDDRLAGAAHHLRPRRDGG